ncbi:MAG TPA: hypothetical protein VL294_09680 [Pseudolysinimonas sp.]|nr:hypothetical protein [Pseudolysinimonas sp.]
MLEPQSRAALTEQLKPPPGFELSHAVGTTFTLDLATALAVPLSFASQRLSTDDTLGVLDAIRRAADRVDVFAQAGEISMGVHSDLVAFLEPMIHPVSQRRGLFHPKVWFLEYRAGDLTSYRFLCASRNLTSDHSWDVVVRLDGVPAAAGSKRDAETINAPLVRLLREVPSWGVHPLSSERGSRILALADRWRTVAWELPSAVRGLGLHVFGTSVAAAPDLHGKRGLIISPFVSDDGIQQLRSAIRTETHLLSRAESLDRLRPGSLDSRLTTYVLDDAATYNIDEDEPTGAVPSADRLSGLHAKGFVVDRQDGAHVFLGSANATAAGWGNNVEVMVELVGPIPAVGVQATLDALRGFTENYPTAGGVEADPREEAERQLEAFVRRLAATRFTVRVMAGDPHDLRVWGDEHVATVLDGHDEVRVNWHLLTRPDLGSSTVGSSEPDGVVLSGIPLADITPFIVLTARDAAGNERRTIVVARLLDDVESRQDAVIARQLTDRRSFIRLLTLLLELSGVWAANPASLGGTGFLGSDGGTGLGTGLFEALVRAVGDGHSGLADARRIIEYLREHDQQDVLPDGFDELWNQVWAAHLELSGGGK